MHLRRGSTYLLAKGMMKALSKLWHADKVTGAGLDQDEHAKRMHRLLREAWVEVLTCVARVRQSAAGSSRWDGPATMKAATATELDAFTVTGHNTQASRQDPRLMAWFDEPMPNLEDLGKESDQPAWQKQESYQPQTSEYHGPVYTPTPAPYDPNGGPPVGGTTNRGHLRGRRWSCGIS